MKLIAKIMKYTPKRILVLIVMLIMRAFGMTNNRYETNNEGKIVKWEFYRDGWE